MVLSLTAVLIRHACVEHATLTGLLVAGGWEPFPPGKQELFARVDDPKALINFLAHVRRDQCIPVPYPI